MDKNNSNMYFNCFLYDIGFVDEKQDFDSENKHYRYSYWQCGAPMIIINKQEFNAESLAPSAVASFAVRISPVVYQEYSDSSKAKQLFDEYEKRYRKALANVFVSECLSGYRAVVVEKNIPKLIWVSEMDFEVIKKVCGETYATIS